MANKAFLEKIQSGTGLITKAVDEDDIEDVEAHPQQNVAENEEISVPHVGDQEQARKANEDNRKRAIMQQLEEEDPDEGGEDSFIENLRRDPKEAELFDDPSEIQSGKSTDDDVGSIPAPEDFVFSAPSAPTIAPPVIEPFVQKPNVEQPVPEAPKRKRPGPKPKQRQDAEAAQQPHQHTQELPTITAPEEAHNEEPAFKQEVNAGNSVSMNKDSGLAYAVLDYVCQKTIESLLETYESEIYMKAYVQNLFRGYMEDRDTAKNPLFVELIRECIRKGIKDEYLKEHTESVLKYIINE